LRNKDTLESAEDHRERTTLVSKPSKMAGYYNKRTGRKNRGKIE